MERAQFARAGSAEKLRCGTATSAATPADAADSVVGKTTASADAVRSVDRREAFAIASVVVPVGRRPGTGQLVS